MSDSKALMVEVLRGAASKMEVFGYKYYRGHLLSIADYIATQPTAAARDSLRYFSHDGDNTQIFDTLDEAKSAAERVLQYYADRAENGWDENSLSVCYGIVLAEVRTTESRPVEPEDGCAHGISTHERRELVPLAATLPESGGQGFVMVPVPEPNCRERLRVEGKPYPRSGCAVCGKFSPKSGQCDALLAGIAAAAPRPA